MKILTPIGSKKRFLEMFQGVNKLNEGFGESQNPIDMALDALVNGNLNIEQVNNQVSGDESIVEISGTNGELNVTFKFKVHSSRTDQEGVNSVDSADLIFAKVNDNEVDENSMASINANRQADLIAAISEYVEFESDTVTDEMFEDAVKFIDNVPYNKGSEEIQTQKAYADQKPTNPELRVQNPELQKFVKEEEEEFIPHGGYGATNSGGYEVMLNNVGDAARVRDAFGSDNPQTSDWLEIEEVPNEEGEYEPVIDPNGYNIPLNQVMRYQKSITEIQDYAPDEEPNMEFDPTAMPPEYGDEALPNPEDDGSIGVDPYDSPEVVDDLEAPALAPENAAVINQAYENLVQAGNPSPTMEETAAEANKLQGINTEPAPKTRTIPRGAEEFFESTDQDKFEDVVFMQGEEADEALEILRNQGEDAALEHLMQWHQPGSHMGSAELGHGSNDQTFEKDGYIMSWSIPLNYIGLQYDLSGLNEDEETYPKQMGKRFKPKNQMPKKKKKHQTVVKLSEEDEADIEQVMQDKEEAGDELEGGLADDKSPFDFCPKQIAKGIEVEMEHTENPLIAIEIVMDHLVEDPKYYGETDEDPEAAAMAGAQADAEGTEDDELTDELLGFKPHNVGDYTNENEFADREKNYHDREDMQNNPEEYMGSEEQGKMEVRTFEEASKIDFNGILNFLVNRSTQKIEAGYIGWNIPQGYSEKYSGPENKTDFVLVSNDALRSPRPYLEFPEGIDYTKPENWVRGNPVGTHPLAEILDDGGTVPYQPKDNIKGVNLAEDDYEEYQGNTGDRYADAEGNEFSVRGKVKGGVTLKGQGGEKEVNTGSLSLMKNLGEAIVPKEIISEEQIKTARQALNNRGLTEGMTKKEAIQLLIKHNIK